MDAGFIVLTKDEETKLRIAHSLGYDAGNASVSEICKRAGVSRQTFYRHFSSKEAVNDWYNSFLTKHFLFETGRKYSFREGISLHCRLLRSEAEFAVGAMPQTYRGEFYSLEDILIERRMRTAREANILAIAREKGLIAEDDPKAAFCIDAYVRLEVHAIDVWIIDGMPLEPDLFADCLAACVPDMLKPVLDA